MRHWTAMKHCWEEPIVLKTAFEMAGEVSGVLTKVSPFQNPWFQVEMICSITRSQILPK